MLLQNCGSFASGRLRGDSVGNLTPQHLPIPSRVENLQPGQVPPCCIIHHCKWNSGPDPGASPCTERGPFLQIDKDTSTPVPCRDSLWPSVTDDTAENRQHFISQPQDCSSPLIYVALRGNSRPRKLTLPEPPGRSQRDQSTVNTGMCIPNKLTQGVAGAWLRSLLGEAPQMQSYKKKPELQW